MKYILFFLLIISFNLYGEEKNLIFGDIKIELNNEISRNEISKLNLEDIAVLRNGIYAKHGYKFKKEKYKNYFQKISWYKPEYDDVEQKLFTIDRDNIEKIQKFIKIRDMGLKSSEYFGYNNTTYINENGIKIRIKPIEIEEGNNPQKVLIKAGDCKENFESEWNDGLIIGIVDFDKKDNYIDIFITESGTDVSGTTYIYRYDGKLILKYCEIYQSFLEIYYDENGMIYFSDWDNNKEEKINKQLNYKNKKVSIINDKKIYQELNNIKK